MGKPKKSKFEAFQLLSLDQQIEQLENFFPSLDLDDAPREYQPTCACDGVLILPSLAAIASERGDLSFPECEAGVLEKLYYRKQYWLIFHNLIHMFWRRERGLFSQDLEGTIGRDWMRLNPKYAKAWETFERKATKNGKLDWWLAPVRWNDMFELSVAKVREQPGLPLTGVHTLVFAAMHHDGLSTMKDYGLNFAADDWDDESVLKEWGTAIGLWIEPDGCMGVNSLYEQIEGLCKQTSIVLCV